MGCSESSVNRLRDLFRLSDTDPDWAVKRSNSPRVGLFSSPCPAEQVRLATCWAVVFPERRPVSGRWVMSPRGALLVPDMVGEVSNKRSGAEWSVVESGV